MTRPGDSEIHDVFISYKRKTASAEARLIRSHLRQQGLKVFMDVTDLGSGLFDESLLRRIAATRNFVLILAPHALDKCHEEKDWLRREIRQAIESKCNLVPVLLPEFKFPKELPEDIRDLSRYQSVEYSHLFFDAMMERLLGMLDVPSGVKPHAGPEERNARRSLLLWAVSGVVALALLATAGLLVARRKSGQAGDARILKTVGSLRQDFRRAVDAAPASRQQYIAAAQADVDSILQLDPRNGTGFYYQGEIKRLSTPGLFTEKSCPIAAGLKQQQGSLDAYETDFYHYLDIEASLPSDAKGGDASGDLCYSRPSGYCPQRTAWIDHLLANDLYQEALIAGDRATRADELGRALKLAQQTGALYQDQEHNPGFTQCTSTETLVQLIQGQLGLNK